MTTTKRQKVFYYKRAYIDIPKGKRGYKKNLEELLVEAHQASSLATTFDRSFTTAAGEIQCPHVRSTAHGLQIHITLAKVGGSASTVPRKSKTTISKLASVPPPQNYDFLNGDVVALIKGNNVITCTTRIRDGILAQYARWAIDQASIIDDKFLPGNTEKLALSNIADINKIKKIKNEGVSEIILSSSLYAATKMDGTNESGVGAVLNSAAEKLQLMFSRDSTAEDIDELENLNVNVSIKFDGKRARSKVRPAQLGDSGNAHLLIAAEKLLNDHEPVPIESDFMIVTKKNTKISSDEIRICAPKGVSELGNSIDPYSAWPLMESYLAELEQTGLTCN